MFHTQQGVWNICSNDSTRFRTLKIFTPLTLRFQDFQRKLESTVRYLGIEVDDALEMAEQTEV
jgi:hypothetical protein